MAQEQVSVVLDLNQYGINQQLTISVPKTIEGVTYNEGDAFVPRNEIERCGLYSSPVSMTKFCLFHSFPVCDFPVWICATSCTFPVTV